MHDDKMTKDEMKEVMEHLDGHFTYPATKGEIVKACNMMSDVPEKHRKWFMEALPEGTYKNAEEVKAAVEM